VWWTHSAECGTVCHCGRISIIQLSGITSQYVWQQPLSEHVLPAADGGRHHRAPLWRFCDSGAVYKYRDWLTYLVTYLCMPTVGTALCRLTVLGRVTVTCCQDVANGQSDVPQHTMQPFVCVMLSCISGRGPMLTVTSSFTLDLRTQYKPQDSYKNASFAMFNLRVYLH